MKYVLWLNDSESEAYESEAIQEAISNETLPNFTLARLENGNAWEPISELLTKYAHLERRNVSKASPVQNKEIPKQPATVSNAKRKRLLVPALMLVAVLVIAVGGIWVYSGGYADYQKKRELNNELAIAKDAVVEFDKLNSATEAGLNYPAYQQMVLDAKIKIDPIIEKLPDGWMKDDLQEAMDGYIAARDFWGHCIAHPAGGDGDMSYFDKESQERFANFGVLFTDGYSGTAFVPIIWKKTYMMKVLGIKVLIQNKK